jgi:predicted MFS family arabinose efflux permease
VTPFHSRAFRALWCSSIAAAVANGMERTATAWMALTASDVETGAFAVGLVLAARMLPSLLLGLAAGTIADQTYRPRLLFGVATAACAVMALFAWLVGAASVHVWYVVAISMTAGCLQVFDTPARQALALDTVPRDVAANALALNALAARLMVAVGSLIAGLLIAATSAPTCYWAIAAGWGCAAVLVLAVHTRGQQSGVSARGAFGPGLRRAARLIFDNPSVRTLTIASVACEVFAFSFMSAVPVFARDVLRVGPDGYGTLNAAVSVGGSVAVIALLMVPGHVPREPILSTVFVVYGASLLALSATRDLGLTAAVLVVTGACAASFDVLQQTLIQLAVGENERGRAMGVWTVGIGSAPLGHLEMGTLASSLGAPSALVINGSLVLLAAATLLLRAPTYRWTPGTVKG